MARSSAGPLKKPTPPMMFGRCLKRPPAHSVKSLKQTSQPRWWYPEAHPRIELVFDFVSGCGLFLWSGSTVQPVDEIGLVVYVADGTDDATTVQCFLRPRWYDFRIDHFEAFGKVLEEPFTVLRGRHRGLSRLQHLDAPRSSLRNVPLLQEVDDGHMHCNVVPIGASVHERPLCHDRGPAATSRAHWLLSDRNE
eukprot:CAMPEP_0194480922 /NCGR_PEP_ID=MMETSP0253-20130528/3564_1 /TAXON_ID=2966 /ORGANISM="Noctiluca scintillans" /LENGTH=193 /DNA_ID=CAMNT_0039320365 /DNA_START=171 /DNA_END=753 /DNA_ORIENTATION=-